MYLFGFEPAVACPRAALGSCKERGCGLGPCSSTLGPGLARRGAAPRPASAPKKKGGDLGGALGKQRLPWARPRGTRVLPLKWFHLRLWDLTSRAAEGTFFFPESRNWEEEEKEAGKGFWEEARCRLRAPRSLRAGWGGAAQFPCSSQVAEEGGGREGREP